MDINIFEDFEVAEGKKKVIISAPHGFIHMKNGEIKLAESMTNVIAEDIAKKYNTYAIYSFINSDTDACYDEDSEYKKECQKVVKKAKIKLFIDIHGMDSSFDSDICIATNNAILVNGDKKFLDDAADIFRSYGFKNVTFDNPYDATDKRRVVSYIHEKEGIDAIEITINGKYRLNTEEYIKVLEDAICEIIKLKVKI